MQKTVKTIQISNKCNKYEFYAFFHLKIDFFVKMKQVQTFKFNLNASRRIFFVSDVFWSFQVKFSTQVGGGHFENIDLALKYQFKTIFYKYKHLF